MSNELFAYEWVLDPDQDTTNIRIYGISPGPDGVNRNICLRVENFKPYAYIQLPDKSDDTARTVIDHLQRMDSPPVRVDILKKNHLYNFENKRNKMSPFMFAAFKSKKHIQDMVFHLKHGINILGETMKLKVHETSASPILQMVSLRDIPMSGWIDFSHRCPEPVPEGEKMTVCDEEYVIKWKNLNRSERTDQTIPKCMAFDMEVNSDFMNQMPSNRPGDCIFQISCVITEKNQPRRKILLSLKAKDMELAESELLAGVEVRVFDEEKDLLVAFMNLIAVERPNVLTGFNIFGFDIEYAMKRAVRFFLADDFKLIGFNKHTPALIEEVKWSSSAYKNQVFKFINWEGILLLDLLPIIRRDYKLDTYTLKNVTATFLNNNTKDPVTYKDIFIACRTREKMDVVGKYCVQDSDLCIELMNHLHTWVALSEMAKVCNVSMFTLYTQGQQIKLYSQVYKYCLKENIVVDNDGYEAKSNERYRGAYVIEPTPGFYERVVPVDFSSLYPSLIIGYNICYSTITDETTPDDQCNIFDWEDHVGCEHDPKEIEIKKLSDNIDKIGKELSALRTKRDEIKVSTVAKGTTVKDAKAKIQLKIDEKVALQKPYRERRQELKKTKLADREDEDGNKISGVVCAKRYYRFLKPDVKKGVIPTIIQSLLDSRKRVKGLMKKCEDKSQKVVYDKEQLAYKVSANSMYGAMGVKRGYLPFMPGAMCVTYAGRTALEKTAELIQSQFRGTLVYGDTDCVLGVTPVLLQHTNEETGKTNLTYKAIEEISNDDWCFINDNKEKATVKTGYKIWSDDGFTDIHCIVRCGIKKPLTHVVTHVGEVTCSNEHSLLTHDLRNVTPIEVEEGDKLCITELPLPDDTPASPMYNRLDMDTIISHEILDDQSNISAQLAFVWGLFYADGSCGKYIRKDGHGIVNTWAINNQNRKVIERCADIFNSKYSDQFEFKILETMKSSVYKLVPKQFSRKKENSHIKDFVNQYREMFYTGRKDKQVPSPIFTASYEVRHAFFLGYWAGDGATNDCLTLSNKGSVGSAGLFFLARSLGYKASINIKADKPNVYKLTFSTPDRKFRKQPNAIKKKVNITNTTEKYIYDIQTSNHHFAAGVGQLVIHNSNYVTFPHIKSISETWDYAIKVADGVTNWTENGKRVFPHPIKLEFENTIYERFLILSKKRYMYQEIDRDGNLNKKVGKKGVILARRDNSQIVRSLYEKVTAMIFDKKTRDDLYTYVNDYVRDIYDNKLDQKDYVITKSVGDSDGNVDNETGRVGDYKVKKLPCDPKERVNVLNGQNEKEYYISCMPAQVQLAERMKRRGVPVDAGSRIEYVVTRKPGVSTLGQKIEDYDYFKRNASVLELDPKYYVDAMINPLDQIFKTMGYGDMMKQLSAKWDKISKEREEAKRPILVRKRTLAILDNSSLTPRGDRI